MVEVLEISKSFSDVVALAGVTFTADRGVNVIIGPNGAGKTTTLRCISGVVSPDSGSVKIFGKDPGRIKERIAVLSEDRRILRRMKVKDYEQLLPLLYPNWNGKLFKKFLAHFSIRRDQNLDTLSAGMRTVFLLSVLIASGADVLILDEPTQHLDPVKVNELETLLRELGTDKILIVASHHLEEVEGFADRFVILNEGRVVYSDDIDSAKEKHRIVAQNQIGEYDEVIGFVESGWLVKTEEDKGRYPSLREIVLAYLKRDEKTLGTSITDILREDGGVSRTNLSN